MEPVWGWGRWQLPRTHVLSPGHVLVGGVGLHACVSWGSHCGVCLKSAVTNLVYFELCFLNSFCFVFKKNFFLTTTGWPTSREWVTNLSFYHNAVCYRKFEGGFQCKYTPVNWLTPVPALWSLETFVEFL